MNIAPLVDVANEYGQQLGFVKPTQSAAVWQSVESVEPVQVVVLEQTASA